jgi:hypothetical protein
MSAGAGAVQSDADHVDTALAAIDSAKALAKAGRGTLLRVGSILSTDDNSPDDVIVVLDYPVLRDMKPGMVLILAKQGCEPIDDCLIARRVTQVTDKYGVETEPYGGAEGLLLTRSRFATGSPGKRHEPTVPSAPTHRRAAPDTDCLARAPSGPAAPQILVGPAGYLAGHKWHPMGCWLASALGMQCTISLVGCFPPRISCRMAIAFYGSPALSG